MNEVRGGIKRAAPSQPRFRVSSVSPPGSAPTSFHQHPVQKRPHWRPSQSLCVAWRVAAESVAASECGGPRSRAGFLGRLAREAGALVAPSLSREQPITTQLAAEPLSSCSEASAGRPRRTERGEIAARRHSRCLLATQGLGITAWRQSHPVVTGGAAIPRSKDHPHAFKGDPTPPALASSRRRQQRSPWRHVSAPACSEPIAG